MPTAPLPGTPGMGISVPCQGYERQGTVQAWGHSQQAGRQHDPWLIPGWLWLAPWLRPRWQLVFMSRDANMTGRLCSEVLGVNPADQRWQNLDRLFGQTLHHMLLNLMAISSPFSQPMLSRLAPYITAKRSSAKRLYHQIWLPQIPHSWMH